MKSMKRFATRITAAILFCIAAQVVHAQLPPSAPPTNTLATFSFSDTNGWTDDASTSPNAFTNLFGAFYGDGTSLMVDRNNPAWLQFGGFNSDGTTNLSVGPAGSIFFWFSPDWASATTNNNGAGPGAYGRLLEVGAYSTNATYGWFSLFVDPGATNIYFCTQTNSGDSAVYTNLSAPIDWATNVWQFVALTYSPTNLSLYTNGVLATNAPSLVVYPGLDVLTNGFWIGSDSNGILQMHGWMDDLYTYDYSLDATTVADIYQWFYDIYLILPYDNVMSDSQIQSAPLSSSSSSSNYLYVLNSPGSLNLVGSAASCTTNTGSPWITNLSCVLTTNGATFTFTIEGGSASIPYDVFANNVLSFGTNGIPWVWLGRGYACNTYAVSNLPPTTVFEILGNSQIDSDGDGLSDAFERLVTHTNPYTNDTDGDGVSDFIEWLQGRNPLTAGAVMDTNGTVKLTIYTPMN